MRITTLQWAVGAFCTFIGTTMLTVPHQFSTPAQAALQPHLLWWGLALLVAGSGLLAAAALPPRTGAVWVVHLAACAVLLMLARSRGMAGAWTGMITYALLGLGTAVAPLAVSRTPDRDASARGRHWLAVVVGSGAALSGLSFLVLPGQFGAPVYDRVRPHLLEFAVPFLAGGLALVYANLGSAAPRLFVLAAHLLTAGTFLAFVAVWAVPLHTWTGIAYYGGFGAAVALLPWVDPLLVRLRATSLRMRFAMALTAIVAISLIAPVALVGFWTESVATEEAMQTQRTLAVALAQDVSDFIILHRNALATLAAYPGLLQMAPAAQQRLLRAYVRNYSDVAALDLADAAGNPLARSDGRPGGRMAGQQLFEEARRTNGPSLAVMTGRITHRPVIQLGMPLRGRGGEFGGLAGMAIEMTRVTSLLAHASANVSGDVYLVDGRGHIIAHRDVTLVAAFADISDSPPVAASAGRGGASGAVKYRTPAGERIAGFARVPGPGWGIVVDRPLRAALTGADRGRELSLLVHGVVMVVAALAAVLAAGALAKPLEALAREAGQLGRGSTPAAFPPSTIAEVVDLTAALGQMQARLATRTEEREGAYRALQASEQRIRLILEKSPVPFVMVNADGLVTGWNAQAEATFGWVREEAVARPLADLILPVQYRETLTRGLVRFLATGEGPVLNKRIEATALHRDGREFPIELTIAPLWLGDAWTFNVFINDITARKRVEESQTRYAHELERSNAELQQFAYVASHDLQEPLRMVTSYVQLLARRYKGRLDPDADQFIAYAVDGATRMQELINDLLEFSRVRTTGAELTPTDANAVLSETLANLQMAIHDSRAAVTHDPLPTVLADASQLGQVFQNLIGNAIKFHRKGERPAVHVWAREHDGEWILSVQDNGIGIDPQSTERVFEIFQRLHGRNEYPGTGVGLAICKRIVERHGGRIWVESEPGRGATFSFTLGRRGNADEI